MGRPGAVVRVPLGTGRRAGGRRSARRSGFPRARQEPPLRVSRRWPGTVVALEVSTGMKESCFEPPGASSAVRPTATEPFGTVTIFCGTSPSPTTVIGPTGRSPWPASLRGRAARKVLVEGGTSLDRALVVERLVPLDEPFAIPEDGRSDPLRRVLEREYLDVSRPVPWRSCFSSRSRRWGCCCRRLAGRPRRPAQPLGSLAEAAQAVARRQLDTPVSPANGGRKIDRLARAFRSMVNTVRSARRG